MSKHTPGPWRYDSERAAIVADVPPSWADATDPDQEKITEVVNLRGAMGGHDTEADKGVLIAAPDMLACLKAVAEQVERSDYWWMSCPDKGGFDLEAINAAIAKAEGR